MTKIYVFSPVHAGEYNGNDSQTFTEFLLGVSARQVDPSEFGSLFTYETLPTQQEAADRLASRIREKWAGTRTVAALPSALDGLKRLRMNRSILMQDAGVQATLAAVEREARERAEEADRQASQPRKVEGDWISKKLEVLERRVADLETRLMNGAAA